MLDDLLNLFLDAKASDQQTQQKSNKNHSFESVVMVLVVPAIQKETQVRKQAVHMTQEKSLKVFRSKILQAAKCTFSAFLFAANVHRCSYHILKSDRMSCLK